MKPAPGPLQVPWSPTSKLATLGDLAAKHAQKMLALFLSLDLELFRPRIKDNIVKILAWLMQLPGVHDRLLQLIDRLNVRRGYDSTVIRLKSAFCVHW